MHEVSMNEELMGRLADIIFHNSENGYLVGVLETDDGEEITVVGTLPLPREGGTYAFFGKQVIHPAYGHQFAFDTYEEVVPQTAEAIEAFLASGIIRGIGPSTASLIVKAFGDRSLEIIENEPERLLDISGIGPKKLVVIKEGFDSQREVRNIVMFLRTHGISASFAGKIYKKYGSEAISQLEKNPYRLVDDIWGIGFRQADEIASKLGIDRDSDFRIESGIKYLLTREAGEGNTFVPAEELTGKAASILGLDRAQVEDVLDLMPFKGMVRIENLEGRPCVFLMNLYLCETKVCSNLVRLLREEHKSVMADLDGLILKTEALLGIKLSEEQRRAVDTACRNGVCVITGGPGTGKTTIINTIIRMFIEGGLDVAVAAPTGRAAKRITETSGFEAKTIHRLLEYSASDEDRNFMSFARDEDNPLDADVIVIDEASMIDIVLMNALLKAVKPGARLILVGDADQLPPVGPGNVLRDIIESDLVETVRLGKIFRQAEESLIVVNAHRINRGEDPYYNEKDKDFFFLKKAGQEDILQTIKDLCTRRLATFVEDFDPLKGCQVISPVKKGVAGTINLNLELQKVLNPASHGLPEIEHRKRVFRPGDKVMQIKNNYDIQWKNLSDFSEGTGIFNGDVGYIKEIDKEYGEVSVIFEDVKLAVYDTVMLDELDLAYAVTVHKSQGSEYPVVIMPMMWIPPLLATRNLLYTAVTRAKNLVVLVGNPAIMKGMVGNNTISRRNSGLAARLRVFLNYE